MSRAVRLFHDLGVSPPLVPEPQADLGASPGGQIVVEKIFGHVETLRKLRHIAPKGIIHEVTQRDTKIGIPLCDPSCRFVDEFTFPSDARSLPSRSSHQG